MADTALASVIVVGAGLSGSLISLYLARAGHRVEVYERRPDPRLHEGDSGRSINLGVSARGLAALREVGLADQLLTRAVPMRGRMVHGRSGTPRLHPYGTREDQVLHSVLRQDLNVLLIEAAEKEAVEFHFGTRLTALDPDGGRCRFAAEARGDHEATADLVIGADGAFSTVREHLVRGGRVDYRQDFLDWGYKELTIPAATGGAPGMELHALHVWPSERGLMVAHPNADGSLTCTLFLPFGGAHGFAALDTAEAVSRFFDSTFPGARTLMPDLVPEFAARPVGAMVTIRTSRWHHGDRVALIGDACHAVYPFYGQGMNAAFEDCSVLASCLRELPHDRAAALAEYQRRRKPHTDVLAELAQRNFVELRDGMRSRLVLARKRADLVLNRLLGDAWLPLYTMVSHTTMPYGEALARSRRQDRLLARLVAASLCSALGVIATGAARRRRRAAHRWESRW